jgi:hypothetical protein
MQYALSCGRGFKVRDGLLRLMTLLEGTSWRHPRRRRYMQCSIPGASSVSVYLILLTAVQSIASLVFLRLLMELAKSSAP